MWGREKFIKSFDGKQEGKRPLGRTGRGWEDRIKMDIKRPEWASWIGLTWLRTGTGGGLL
jgi:hypothetical protein